MQIRFGSNLLSIWIRKKVGDSSVNVAHLAEHSRDLRDLLSSFSNWLAQEGSQLDPGECWIADIGFSPRAGALGGGPILSTELMAACVASNISIYLSEYSESE